MAIFGPTGSAQARGNDFSPALHPPALVAKMSASLQSLSQGRFVLGYGAGWKQDEYLAYGYDFPSAARRIAMMEEGLQIIKALWREEQATFRGQYYQIENARCEPRPNPLPPIMIGGAGEQLTLRRWLAMRIGGIATRCPWLRRVTNSMYSRSTVWRKGEISGSLPSSC